MYIQSFIKINKNVENRGFNLKGKKSKKVMPKRIQKKIITRVHSFAKDYIKKIFCNMTVTSKQQFQLPLRKPTRFFSQAEVAI